MHAVTQLVNASRLLVNASARLMLVGALLTGCAGDEKPALPPPPDPSLCIWFSPWNMSPPAAAVETIENIRTHAANNQAHHERCLLDPARPRGPR